MSDYRIIQTQVLPQITEVRLYDETSEHVVASHPEIPAALPGMPMMIEAVAKALREPTLVEPSRPGAYVFVDGETTNHGGDPLRIPVKVVEGTSAVVKTFYFGTTSAPRPPIWTKDNG